MLAILSLTAHELVDLRARVRSSQRRKNLERRVAVSFQGGPLDGMTVAVGEHEA